MKSQFYREVSNEQKTRKCTTKPRSKKQSQHSGLINPITISRDLKSGTRGPIDPNRKLKPETEQHMLRISFSRPLLNNQLQTDPAFLTSQKSLIHLCSECQTLRAHHDKQQKSLKMIFQQQMTAQTQRFIQMEKKYLMKQNELIKHISEHLRLIQVYQELEGKLRVQSIEAEEWRERCEAGELEIVRLIEEGRKNQEQNKFFNHFLTAFVEQTKCMLNWSNLFEKTCDQLPTFINLVKDELFCLKIDLDLILKESLNYKQLNFANSEIKEPDNQSFFFGSEEDSRSSFFKYLKHNPCETRVKTSRIVPLTELKERNCEVEAFSLNKENMDTANRPSFQMLIHSRLKMRKEKQKSQKRNDQFFRLLLIQAQTIESSHEYKSSALNSKSLSQINTSLLSQITQQVEHQIY